MQDQLIPILRYRDPAAAIEWLCSAFALKGHFVTKEEGKVVHAQLSLGSALLFLGLDHEDDKCAMHSPLSLNFTNRCVYIATGQDIDDHCVQAASAGAQILTAPHDSLKIKYSFRANFTSLFNVGDMKLLLPDFIHVRSKSG